MEAPHNKKPAGERQRAYTLRGRCIGYDAPASFAIEVIATPQ
jgi:hypothetical protein